MGEGDNDRLRDYVKKQVDANYPIGSKISDEKVGLIVDDLTFNLNQLARSAKEGTVLTALREEAGDKRFNYAVREGGHVEPLVQNMITKAYSRVAKGLEPIEREDSFDQPPVTAPQHHHQKSSEKQPPSK